MLYKKDFQYFTKFCNIRKNHFKLSKSTTIEDPEARKQNKNAVWSFIKFYCERSSLHGLQYIVQHDLKAFERMIWILVVFLSLSGTTYISILLGNRFYSSPLEIVIDSTIYPVHEIPFPSVTICNYNRVNWKKIEAAKLKFVPNATEEVIDLFTEFVRQMDILQYGKFDQFAIFENVSLAPLDHINIAELFEFMHISCKEIFSDNNCWWRNKFIPCCNFFWKQETELGICYAFNSVASEIGFKIWKLNETAFPYRSKKFGPRSGLKIRVFTDPKTKDPKSKNDLGILAIINSPFEWPSSGVFLPTTGGLVSVIIKPKLSYATPGTRRFHPTTRECIFTDEVKNPIYKNIPYFMRNCFSICRQSFLVATCNCTVETFFPPAFGNYTPCKASDFHCLNKYNDIYNLEEDTIEEGKNMSCSCLLECYAVEYEKLYVPMHFTRDNYTEGIINLDIHYKADTLVKYRLRAVYSWLDFLVSFGGIAGLFMGASILSGFELFYYLTIGLGVYIQGRFQKMPNSKNNPISTAVGQKSFEVARSKFWTKNNLKRRNKIRRIYMQ